jgi:hypothetical protein
VTVKAAMAASGYQDRYKRSYCQVVTHWHG